MLLDILEVFYFGTGGLVRAYSDSLKKAIEKAKKVKKHEGEQLEIEVNYSDFEKVKYYCEKSKININKIEYLENIVCILDILEGKSNKILEDFQLKSIKIKKHKNLSKKFITVKDE